MSETDDKFVFLMLEISRWKPVRTQMHWYDGIVQVQPHSLKDAYSGKLLISQELSEDPAYDSLQWHYLLYGKAPDAIYGL